MTFNLRFPVVYAGVIGLDEGYKTALAVYRTLAMYKDKPVGEKRPLVLIVDTPGNGPVSYTHLPSRWCRPLLNWAS